MKIIEHDGDTWKVLASGEDRDGKTRVHLASTTRNQPRQKNGINPVQRMEWIDTKKLNTHAKGANHER